MPNAPRALYKFVMVVGLLMIGLAACGEREQYKIIEDVVVNCEGTERDAEFKNIWFYREFRTTWTIFLKNEDSISISKEGCTFTVNRTRVPK